MNNKPSKLKAVVILLVLMVLVLVPIVSSADTIPEKSSGSDNHATLTITAEKTIVMPFGKGTITTDQIVAKAKPSAILTKHITIDNIEQTFPVTPSYFISDKELDRMNAVTSKNESVVITLFGQYVYNCEKCTNDQSIIGEVDIKVDFTGPEYKVTFNGNGGTVDGKKVQEVILTPSGKNSTVTLTSSNMPKTMKRDGYKFKGWSTSKDKYIAFKSNTAITDDVTIYAFWTKLNVAGKVTPAKKATKDKIDLHSATFTRNSLILSEATSLQNNTTGSDISGNTDPNSIFYSDTDSGFMSAAEEQDIPVATIGASDIPLYSPEGIGSWAYINIILAIMGALMALICLFFSIKGKKDKKSLWFLISMAAGIVGIVFFFLTENLSYYMVLVDKWTVVNAILFVLSAVAMILFLRESEDPEEYTFDY